MKLKNITETVAVNTKYEEEAESLMRVLTNNGFVYISGTSLLPTTHWEVNKENTCYFIKDNYVKYGSVLNNVYSKPLSLSDFLNKYNEDNPLFSIDDYVLYIGVVYKVIDCKKNTDITDIDKFVYTIQHNDKVVTLHNICESELTKCDWKFKIGQKVLVQYDNCIKTGFIKSYFSQFSDRRCYTVDIDQEAIAFSEEQLISIEESMLVIEENQNISDCENQNSVINIAEMLAGHEGITLYSKAHGPVKFKCIHDKKADKDKPFIIVDVLDEFNAQIYYKYDGTISKNGETLLFPSKEQQDWNKWYEENKIPSYKTIRSSVLNPGYYYLKQDYGEISTIHAEADCFDTVSEAHLDKLIAINKLMIVKKYLEKDWVPDWNNRDEDKFYICLYPGDDSLHIESSSILTTDIFFSSKENAQTAIKILGEDIIKTAMNYC